jgi:hypothetical protein
MKKQILSEEIKRLQKLAGIINENKDNTLETKIKQWINNNAGGYGPEETDPNYSKFVKEMNPLLNNTLEDFNPDYYGDDTSMSPNDILEDFIDGAIDIISKYTMGDYGDSTSFSPDDIKNEFYEFIGVDPITESNQINPEFEELKKQQTAIKNQQAYLIKISNDLKVDRKLIGDYNGALNSLLDAIFKANYNK